MSEAVVEIKRACDACRTKKIKCNKVLPCETCVKRNRFCTFEYALGKQRKISPQKSEPKPSHNFAAEPSLALQTCSEAILPPPYKGDLLSFDENISVLDVNSIKSLSLFFESEKNNNSQNTSGATSSPTPLATENVSYAIPGSSALLTIPAVQLEKKDKASGSSSSSSSGSGESSASVSRQTPKELPKELPKEIPTYERNVMNTLVSLEPKIDSLLKTLVNASTPPMSVATTAALLRFFRDINPTFPLFDLDYFLRNLAFSTPEFNTILKSITLLMHGFEKDPNKTKQFLHNACQTYITIFGLIPPTLPFFVATFVLHNTLTALFNLNNTALTSS